MTRRYAIVLLPAVLFGCSSSDAEPAAGSNAPVSAEQAQEEDTEKLVLAVWTDDAEGNSQLQEYKEPSAQDVERILRSFDWNNQQLNPSVTLSRRRQVFIAAAGRFDAVAEDEKFAVQWQDYDELGKHHVWDTPPLGSIDDAVSLFLSFHNNDSQLPTLAEWIEY